jgi:hypothetical protein
LTPNWVIGTFAVVGLIFIPIGIVLHSESDNVVEYSVLYDTPGELDAQSKESIVQLGNGCMLKEEKEGNTFDIKTHGCTITFTLGKDMKAPIYVYYQLDNFYQNHRRYVQSRSDAQLRGDANAGTNDCAPLQKTPSDVIKYNSTYGILNEEKKTYFLNPCGLIANSLFNDIFWVNRIVTKDNQVYGRNDTYGDKQVINLMNQSGIAWKSDVETKFQNIKENQLKEDNLYLWQNEKYRNIIPSRVGQEPRENVTAWTTNAPAYGVQDEHFIVWMRTAGLPNFRKLYGRIETDLEKGTKLEFLVSSSKFLLYNTVCMK